MTVEHLINAARVPDSVPPFKRGRINGKRLRDHRTDQRFQSYYALCEVNLHGLHMVDDDGYGGYVIMEDTERELRRHLPFLLGASGRVLKTGLGLGCVVRALLSKESIEHIDVIEINHHIIEHFGREFFGSDRVTIHHGDALELDVPGRWDAAWHDIYTEGNEGLCEAHARLMLKYQDRVCRQGAWQFPREIHIAMAHKGLPPLIGAPRKRAAHTGAE